MARGTKTNGTDKDSARTRYWISVDLGLIGNFRRLYEWLDSYGAEECGSGLATFKTTKSRDTLTGELKKILAVSPRARAYIISMKQGGRFVVGGRKVPQWRGYATPAASELDES
jgi:hypothetical protein